MFRFRGACAVWERYRTDEALLPARPLIGESQERVARAIRLRRMTGDVGVSPTIKFPLLLARRRGPGRRLDEERG